MACVRDVPAYLSQPCPSPGPCKAWLVSVPERSPGSTHRQSHAWLCAEAIAFSVTLYRLAFSAQLRLAFEPIAHPPELLAGCGNVDLGPPLSASLYALSPVFRCQKENLSFFIPWGGSSSEYHKLPRAALLAADAARWTVTDCDLIVRTVVCRDQVLRIRIIFSWVMSRMV